MLAIATSTFAATEAPAARATSQGESVRDIVARSGSGDRVLSLRLPRGPLIFTLAHSGDSNFIVRLTGSEGAEYLANEIGSWVGATVAPDVRSGRHRLAIEADGRWQVFVQQPLPRNFGRPLIRSHAFRVSMVYPVRSYRSGQLVASATHAGAENFIVRLVGVGSLSGTEYLFNEIGHYHGQVLVDVPKGPMLLWVQASGRWSVRFSR